MDTYLVEPDGEEIYSEEKAKRDLLLVPSSPEAAESQIGMP